MEFNTPSKTIHTMINGLYPGFAGYYMPNAWPRSDIDLEQKDIFNAIRAEGNRLAGEDKVSIGDGKSIVVFNTGFASPHGPFVVPAHEFDSAFRTVGSALDYKIESETLIQYRNKETGKMETPSHIPLDMGVWLMLEDNDGQTKPVDLSDFTSPPTGDPDIDKFRLQLSDDKLAEIYSYTLKRGELAAKTILSLYNNNIRRAFPFLPEKKLADIMQGIAMGYYRKDDVKGLLQFYFDMLGKGAMSNPSSHFRYTCHLGMETLNDLNLIGKDESLQSIIDVLKSKPDYFKDRIELMAVAPDPFKDQNEAQVIHALIDKINPVELVKLIDPYSSIAHSLLSDWLIQRISKRFIRLPILDIQPFRYHTDQFARELRASEGIEVVLQGEENVLAKSLIQFTRLVGEELSPLWEDIKTYVQQKIIMSDGERESVLSFYRREYQLPDNVIRHIDRIRPTEKQLENLIDEFDEGSEEYIKIAEELHHYDSLKKKLRGYKEAITKKIYEDRGTKKDLSDLVSIIQTCQIFKDSDLNEGYNIPGVPSFGLTYHEDEQNNIHILLGWLLSMKGLSELWHGGAVLRQKRDVVK